MRDNNADEDIHDLLDRLAKQGNSAIAHIRPVILLNQQSGRLAGWLGDDKARSATMYVELVAATWQKHHAYLHQLQKQKDDQAWEELFKKLQRWAYRFLLKKGFVPGPETQDLAMAYATETAIRLLDACFPYDLEFDPWAYVVLQHTCYNQIRQAMAQKRRPAEGVLPLLDELSEPGVGPMLRGGPTQRGEMSLAEQQELTQDIMAAIQALPNERWQRVIALRYLQGLSPAEVAEVLGETPTAVYNVQNRALKALREILQQKGYRL